MWKAISAFAIVINFWPGPVMARNAYACGVAPVVLFDNKSYTSGNFLSYLAPWNKDALVQGKDYSECFMIDPEIFPNGQKIAWSWPDAPPKRRGVYNFLGVDFGNYNRTIVKTPIEPRAIKSINALTLSYDLHIDGDLNGFDIIIDLFLTSSPDDSETKSFEIEILLHTPPYTIQYAGSISQTIMNASGRQWSVSIDKNMDPNDILILPHDNTDLLVETIDLKNIFDILVSLAVLSGNEYFNGLGIGVEVRQGKGSLTFNKLSANYN
jgi:hypothetical protein